MYLDNNIKKIVKRLSLKDKTNLLSGQTFWHTYDLTKKGLPPIMMCDGPYGLRKEVNKENIALADTTVIATCFPPSVNLASTWNEELVKEVGMAIAKEAKKEQVSIVLGPGVNIKRSPLCGRNFEYFSEDPYLSGHLGKAFINGVQSLGIGTSLKHFAVNNQETNRLHISANLDERTYREIYLRSFEIAVKEAKPWTIMCSYNRINGTYASSNKFLLKQILRDEWEYEGVVMTDWGAVSDRYKGLKYGLDLEMPTSKGYNNRIIYRRYLTFRGKRKYLYETTYRLVDLIKKGLNNLDKNYQFDINDNLEVACKASEESFVLLKNSDNLLPLTKDDNIAIIGEFAKKPRFQGEGSSHINASKVVNAYDEFIKEYPSLSYARGYDLTSDEVDNELITKAINVAINASKVLLFVGLPTRYESEGYDRKHLCLPASHLKLIEEVAKVNQRVIIILTNGSPVEMPFINDVSAIVEAYLGGQSVGKALFNVLTGKTNFSGKLAETFPLTLESNPSYLNFPGESKEVNYKEGIFVGYRYYHSKKIPTLFNFGYGLSYTTFQYSNLKLSEKEMCKDKKITLSFNVTNVGKYDGKEIVQVYIAPKKPSFKFSSIELRRFTKIDLKVNETKNVSFTLTSNDFMYFNDEVKKYAINSDDYEILVGSSSDDIRLKETITVHGEKPFKVTKFTMDSTVYDVCNHPSTQDYVLNLLNPLAKEMIGQEARYLYEHYDDDMMASMIMTKPLDGLPTMSFGILKRYQIKLLLIVLNRKLKKYNRTHK
jgi:beta-glucosidase